MALATRTGAVRKEDIPSEMPGPDASDSVAAWARAEQRMMSKTVAVTLEKPYLDDPDKTVILVWGRGEPQLRRQGGAQEDGVGIPATSRLGEMDPTNWRPARWEPGRWNHYHLRWNEGPLGKCKCGMDPTTQVGRVCYMPMPVAKVWFGDWDVVSYALSQDEGQVVDQAYTRTYHRDRVANEMWGGYGYDFPAGNAGIRRGELRKFDPPAVPHVSIVRIDTMNRRLPNTEVRPWEIFRWEEELFRGPRAFHAGSPRAADPILQVTESQLNAAIEAAVNAKVAALGKGAK